MKLSIIFIHSNIFISLAAVLLTVESQIQLGMAPQWHPYLFLIFFATLFDYNLHRLITIVTKKDVLHSTKHRWVVEHRTWFYLLVIISILGFVFALTQAKSEVLLALSPFAFLTLFYTLPLAKTAKGLFRLRQIPFLKIFLVSFVWSCVTILLPVVQSKQTFDNKPIILMIIERFLFVFSITIPFDIRDMEADKESGLATIPLYVGVGRSNQIAIIALVLFFTVSYFHYISYNQLFILYAFSISFISTLLFLTLKRLRDHPLYYYGILDGTMLLQGLLVLLFYQFRPAL